MMTAGYGPSGPDAGAGGKATSTSIGTPSNVFTVLRGSALQNRTPSACTVHGTGDVVLVNTASICAAAGAGVDPAPASNASARTTPMCRHLHIPMVRR